jgi:hypothetical protein
MPAIHRTFLESAIPLLRKNPRLVGLAAGGSLAANNLDEYSDLDLIVIAAPDVSADVLRNAVSFAGQLGPLLAAFPGDHVGEMRLLICLYGPPLLHVDLKFVSTDELALRVEDPVVLWDRDGRVAAGLSQGHASYPEPSLQWIEDRFWVWVHYTAVKVARGELFEALDCLAFIRRRVLGPLILLKAGMQPDGVRRIETNAPEVLPELKLTIGGHDRRLCREALENAIRLYIDLRERLAPAGLIRRPEAEQAARDFLADQQANDASRAGSGR